MVGHRPLAARRLVADPAPHRGRVRALALAEHRTRAPCSSAPPPSSDWCWPHSGWPLTGCTPRTPPSDSYYRALGRPAQVTHLGLTTQQATASRLRRTTLAAVKTSSITAEDVGLALGHVDTGNGPGPMCYAGWEDVVLAVMAPRSGKTTSVAIPAICSAPGAVVATSNKLDILYTAALRQKLTGVPPWVFDPQGVARTPQTWWWDPLDAVTTVEEAERLAGHFIAEVEDEKDSIWSKSATELLSGLLLAANLTRSTITQVYKWLADEHDPAPVAALEAGGFDVLAGSLRGLSHAAPETRASVYFTARSGARCLRNPHITAWVTPPPRSLPRLRPRPVRRPPAEPCTCCPRTPAGPRPPWSPP